MPSGLSLTLKPQSNEVQESLIEALRGVEDDSLARKAAKSEGINGSTLQPIYSQRRMRCYSVTESELLQIGIANIGITACFSIGSALMTFWLDIFKDTRLATEIPEDVQTALAYIQPIIFFVSLAFFSTGAAAIWWRKRLMDLIRQESTDI